VEGLEDLERSGRPIEITPLERHQVIATACRSPGEFGLRRPVWSHDALREALISKRLVREISTSEIGRILDDAEIKPHRIQRWCHSDDPQFQAKMRAIVRLYVRRPRGQPVLCVDEKTGMQALSRARPLQRPGPGQHRRQEFEYKRHGTRCLFACFNVGTGKVLARCTKTRKRPGSWLNQVELWFSILSRRVLRYGDFHGAVELVRAVNMFARRWNREEAHPFRWIYEGLPLVG
jgi:hypothetical protein